MKRMLALALTGALVLGLTACGGNAGKGEIVGGGWTIQDSEAASLSEDDQKIFDDAASQWDGGELKAVALLGTQVVAGTNLCYLAYSTLGNDYKLVYIYQDLDNNAELTNVYDLDASADSYGEEDSTEAMTGAWTTADETYAVVDADDAALLDTAQAEMTGAGYELVATLATQVVAGTNYRMLCKQTTVTADPVSTLSILTVYKSADGSIEITNVLPLPIAAISEAE